MRDLFRSILPILIIITVFATSVIIPANCLARYEICKQETFGDPGDDPTIAPNPLTSSEQESALTATNIEKSDIESSLFKVNLLILYNQLTNLIF